VAGSGVSATGASCRNLGKVLGAGLTAAAAAGTVN